MTSSGPPPRPKPAPKPGKVLVYRAVYAYDAQASDELSFDEGDMLYVIDSSSSGGWWQARCKGKVGLIPSNYAIDKLSVTEKSESVDFPLHEAAKRGNIEFLKECLANKVSVNGLDKSGSTPLHWAAHSGYDQVMALLLQQPLVCVDAQNKLGDTPLHSAAWKGHTNCVRMLLEAGANTNLKNREKQRPVDLCKQPETLALLQRLSSGFQMQQRQSKDYEDSSDEDGG